MSERRLNDWLEAYLEYVKHSESARSYHTWAAISVIAGALERKAWITWGHTDIYPNQYIVLVGPSGIRKGEPLTISRLFLERLGMKLVAEDLTREALIKRMKDAVGNYHTPDGSIQFHCSLTGIFEELAVFLGEGDIKFLAALTNWYDSREAWTYETRGRGTEEIKGVCFNKLASTAEDWIPLVIPQGAIGGGYTGRILWVVEHSKGQVIEDPNEYPPDQKLQDDLQHDLEVIHTIAGEFKFEPDALAEYKKWYRRQEEQIAAGKPPISDPRFSPYVSRRATHIKKIAMCVCAARSSSRGITLSDFKRSLALLEAVEVNMPSVFSQVGRSSYTPQMQEVMNFIQTRGRCARSEIMQVFYRDLDLRIMESIEGNLKAMKLISVDRDKELGDWVYEWLGSGSKK